MTDKDFKNVEDIQRMLKYLDKGKLGSLDFFYFYLFSDYPTSITFI